MNFMNLPQHTISELRANYKDREWWRGRIQHRLVEPMQASIYPGYTGSIEVMEENWDTLIVLDACRADLFEERADLGHFDSYQRATSGGSATLEWTTQNFADRSFGDTVYVAANPFTTRLAPSSFHELIEVWKESFNDECNTVLPRAVFNAALGAHRTFPSKRIIVHFMQPHYPFVGSSNKYNGWHPDEILDEKEHGEIHTPWDALQAGLVEKESLWEDYAENLDLVLEYTYKMMIELDGRTVVTSDHGNALGERTWPIPLRIYGHPEGIRIPALTQVPWAVSENGDRRTITDEGASSPTLNSDREVMEERLQALGYRN